MTELGEAFVPIRATLDKLDGDLAGAKSKIEGALGSLQKVGTFALTAAAAGAAAAVAGLAAGLGLAISEAMGAQAIMAQTEAAIKSTGGAAGMTAEQVADLATALSTQSRFSDDAIQSGENLLLTFTNIGADVFPGATQAMVDMATAMGTDVSGGAIQLGKALNDPVAGITALTRVGVTFTDEQKQVIESLVATGDVAGAQQVILAELNKEFGGSAAAAAETFAGKLDVVKNQLLNVAEGIGLQLLPVLTTFIDNVVTPAIPIVISMAEAFGDGIAYLLDFATGARDLGAALEEFGPLEFIAQAFGTLIPEGMYQTIYAIDTFIASVVEMVAQITPYLETAAAWIANNISLQDVLIALGVAIAAVVIPAIASVVAAAAPVVLAFVAVIAVAALLRQAWEENWGGIQEKTAAVWAAVQPLLVQAQEWLAVNLPVAIEALRAWWVDVAFPAIQAAIEFVWPIIQAIFQAWEWYIVNITIPAIKALWDYWVNVAWPAIQNAIAVAWPVVEAIFTALVSFVRDTLIPTVLNLYTQWTTVWWPAIETTLTNVWTVIETVFTELGRWINTNIVPWIVELQRVWAEEVWPAIQKALDDAWAIIKPIWEAFDKWLSVTLPPAVTGLQTIFASAMAAISTAVGPVKTMWDSFAKAVSDFWTWITGKVFSFEIKIPDLPDWAMPGSPLPIHTAWKNFAADLDHLVIAPRFDLGALVPVMGIIGQDDGAAQRNVTYSSMTTVNTNRDPMRVLRASRHLDKLSALA